MAPASGREAGGRRPASGGGAQAARIPEVRPATLVPAAARGGRKPGSSPMAVGPGWLAAQACRRGKSDTALRGHGLAAGARGCCRRRGRCHAAVGRARVLRAAAGVRYLAAGRSSARGRRWGRAGQAFRPVVARVTVREFGPRCSAWRVRTL